MRKKVNRILECFTYGLLIVGSFGLLLSLIGLIIKQDSVYFLGLILAIPFFLFGMGLVLLIVLMYFLMLYKALDWLYLKLTNKKSVKNSKATNALDYNFHTVRCVCYACGWFRVIGFTGKKHPQQAFIRINRDKSDCNLLKASVLLSDGNLSAKEIASKYPAYHDLGEEAYNSGVMNVLKQYEYLLKGRVCPRCKCGNKLQFNWFLCVEFDFDRYKCWRLKKHENEFFHSPTD